jgi:hypothetical protein
VRIVLIHGRGQGGRKKAVLRDEWVAALEEGMVNAGKPVPLTVEVDYPFYGDTLDEFVAQAGLPSPDDVVQKGPGEQPGFEQFMQQALGEMEGSHPVLDEAAIEGELPDEDVGEKGVQNWRWVQAIARIIDRHWAGATDFTIERFLKDVYLYVTNRTVSQRINEIVFELLTDEPTIIVGHSLGSVVSYRVITERGSDLNVVKHVTVGSPLGLRAVSSRLGLPTNTATLGWLNAYDPNDIVALNPLDEWHFNTDPVIENHGEVDNRTPGQHGIAGYLNDTKVAGAIYDALSG